MDIWNDNWTHAFMNETYIQMSVNRNTSKLRQWQNYLININNVVKHDINKKKIR